MIGATTSIDLTKWGSFLFMALIGQLIGLVVNLIWFNSTLYWVTTATGILLFSALTAYDVQKLKRYEQPAGARRGGRREERDRRRARAVPRLRQPLPLSAPDLRPATLRQRQNSDDEQLGELGRPGEERRMARVELDDPPEVLVRRPAPATPDRQPRRGGRRCTRRPARSAATAGISGA